MSKTDTRWRNPSCWPHLHISRRFQRSLWSCCLQQHCVQGWNCVYTPSGCKTRMAPLAAVSIPRLELMGAIVGLQLAKRICKVLELEMRRVIFWLDSIFYGGYAGGVDSRYKPFVANRIGEIQSNTSPEQWHHI